MYLTPQELTTALYSYQITQISENNEQDVYFAINAACEETRSYLTRYDCDQIFSAIGSDRNALVLAVVKTLSVWHLLQKSNIDYSYDSIKERYDRAIDWLRNVRDGRNLPNLPLRTLSSGESETMFRHGSNPKFSDWEW